MVNTLARNARNVEMIPALGAIVPIVMTSMIRVAKTMILYKLCAVYLLNLPHVVIFTICLSEEYIYCKVIACMYIVNITRLQSKGDEYSSLHLKQRTT